MSKKYLKFELLFPLNLMRSYINKSHQIFLISHCNSFTIWCPSNVNVFALKRIGQHVYINDYFTVTVRLQGPLIVLENFTNSIFWITFVAILATAFDKRASHILTVLSPDAVASISASVGCHTN